MKIRIRGQKPEQEKIIEAWLEPHGDGIQLRMSVDGDDWCCRILVLTSEGVSLRTSVSTKLGIELNGEGSVMLVPQ